MVVDTPPQKSDEQYPLLKVESGGGDSGRAPAQTAVAPGWNVTCSHKRAWYERWPELVSACWMTGMLLSIFVLIIYGLGTLGVIRKLPIFVLNCNSSRPENEVYYHQIVQRGEHVPLSRYSAYLSNMASQYTSLHFNIFFLFEDFIQNGYRGQRHSRLINEVLPYHLTREGKICDGFNKAELRDFQLKYPNVNITIMPLTKFMAMTPLRYKWRTIPLDYLAFYARVFSVWKNGGISIDLDKFNNQYNKHQMRDRRTTAILKQYNKGFNPEEYANTLNNIDRDEQNEFSRIFYGIVHQILNETQAFFNNTLSFIQETSSEPVMRKHRNKREVLEIPKNTSPNMNATLSNVKTKLVNTTNLTIIDAPFQNSDTASNMNMSTSEKVQFVKDINLKPLLRDSKQDNKSGHLLQMPVRNGSEVPQILLLYDFSIFADNIGPPHAFPEPMQADAPLLVNTGDGINHVKSKKTSYFLSLTLDGSFIAAVSKQHPFLGHVISAGCQRMPPRIAIQDAMMSQCSSILYNDVYCSQIYMI